MLRFFFCCRSCARARFFFFLLFTFIILPTTLVLHILWIRLNLARFPDFGGRLGFITKQHFLSYHKFSLLPVHFTQVALSETSCLINFLAVQSKVVLTYK